MVAEQLRRYPIPFVVLDTVMVAKSGDPLLTPDAVEAVRQWLLPQVALITPNLPEAAALLGCPPASDEQQMREQGRALLALGCQGVLMKGGHLTGEDSPDWLFTAEGEQRFVAQRVATRNTHGTGCTLSAALAALRPRYGHWGETVAVAKTICNVRWNRPIPWRWGRASGLFIIFTNGGNENDENCRWVY